jgi:hypothetical protein
MYKKLKIENYDKLYGADLGLGFFVESVIMTLGAYNFVIVDKDTGNRFDIKLLRESKNRETPYTWEMKRGFESVRLCRDDVADIETFKRRLFTLVDPLPF